MYLTAQRASGHEQQTGINVYLFTHRGSSTDWGHAAVAEIAERHPGRLECAVTAMPGPGNRVLSFLDVVGPDELSHGDIATELERAMATFPGPREDERPVSWASGPLRLRFYAGRQTTSPEAELRQLRDAILPLLGSGVLRYGVPSMPVARPPTVLIVFVAKEGHGYRYRLQDESRNYLARIMPDRTIPHSLVIPFEIFSDIGGHHWEEYATALTHLKLTALNGVAGLQFIDEADGTLLWDSRN